MDDLYDLYRTSNPHDLRLRPATTFPRFPDLPLEVRLLIWSLAVPPSNLFHKETIGLDHCRNAPKDIIKTCREARDVAQSHGGYIFRLLQQQPEDVAAGTQRRFQWTWFDHSRDLYFIDADARHVAGPVLTNSRSQSVSEIIQIFMADKLPVPIGESVISRLLVYDTEATRFNLDCPTRQLVKVEIGDARRFPRLKFVDVVMSTIPWMPSGFNKDWDPRIAFDLFRGASHLVISLDDTVEVNRVLRLLQRQPSPSPGRWSGYEGQAQIYMSVVRQRLHDVAQRVRLGYWEPVRQRLARDHMKAMGVRPGRAVDGENSRSRLSGPGYIKFRPVWELRLFKDEDILVSARQ